jgi:hypothetical protein
VRGQSERHLDPNGVDIKPASFVATSQDIPNAGKPVRVFGY